MLRKTIDKIFSIWTEKFLEHTDFFEKINQYWKESGFDGEYSHTTFWHSADDENTFKEKKPTNYSKTDITYDLNRFGYRVQKQNNNLKPVDIACFGCSQTFGIGVKFEETWPFYLNEFFLDKNLNISNYGVSGASSDFIARNIHNYLLNHKPKAICCLLPDMFRRELFDSSGSLSPRNFNNIWSNDINTPLIVKCKNLDYNIVDWRAYKQLSGEDNSLFNFIKNIKFIEAMCKANNVKLYTMTWDIYILSLVAQGKFESNSFVGNFEEEKFKYLLNWEKMEKARDQAHLGAPSNKLYAELFAKRIHEDNLWN